MPELTESTTTRKLPEIELAECIAEYVRVTRATIDNVRFLRRAIAAPEPLETCTHETHVHRGGTGVWDESYPCRELGTVCNLADARDPDAPAALYCARHHQKRLEEQAEHAADEQRECPNCHDGIHYPPPTLDARKPPHATAQEMQTLLSQHRQNI